MTTTADDVRERAEEHAESLQRSAANPTEAAAGRFLLWLLAASAEGDPRDKDEDDDEAARLLAEESEGWGG